MWKPAEQSGITTIGFNKVVIPLWSNGLSILCGVTSNEGG